MTRPFDANVRPPKPPRIQMDLTGTVRLLGMQGLGDSFHERPVVNALLRHNPDIEIVTSWPQVFRDMPIRCVRANSNIPYCRDNEVLDAALFETPKPHAKCLPITYLSSELASGLSITRSMTKLFGLEPAFKRYEVPEDWADGLAFPVAKPLMVLRPLVERSIWHASAPRNPLPEVYEAVYNAIRKHYFVVSVADLSYGVETIQSKHDADVEFHDGTLTFRQLMWLFSRAGLVYASPGMGMVVGLHVGTPTIGIFGGYEGPNCYSDATPTPFCAVAPINTCYCLRSTHKCDKTTDIPSAIARAKEFVDATISQSDARRVHSDGIPVPVHQPGGVRNAVGTG